MTTIKVDPDRYRVRISGHALAGQKGEDLVCAGVSTLGFALWNAAMDRDEYHAECKMDRDSAALEVECRPEEDAEAECAEMFRTIMQGFALLRQGRPENIEILIEGD